MKSSNGRTGLERQCAPVAIIGIACRFLGASSPDELWKMLLEGNDSVADYSPGRTAAMDAFYSARGKAATGKNGRPQTTRCGMLPHLKEFDAAFFRISPREAELMDPQQRLLLELGWEAFEDAGVLRGEFAGSDTGVYAGAWSLDYLKLMHGGEGASVLGQNGGAPYSISGRLAYVFDLQGPDISINLGCASGLAAVHLACEGLRAGDCGMALAGGVNAILDPDPTIAFTLGGVLSPDGRCKFGDVSADGFVRSEGAGVFVLKLLAKAIDDGDRIHAVIRGSAMRNSGASSGCLTTPSRTGQAEVLRRACSAAGVAPAQLDYVEAHGTGTAVGDPIEISALAEVVGQAEGRTSACVIGSVKSNIGHTESASGIAGMLKTVLAIKHRFIPASLHVSELNPKIDWAVSGLRLETAGSDWPETNGPALAGVSSFGLTGTNVHLILEEAPKADLPRARSEAWVLPITAHSEAALRELAGRWPERLRRGGQLADLCFTAATRRTALEHRFCVTGTGATELADSIDDWLRGEELITAHHAAFEGNDEGNDKHCVFVFPGQGAQWPGMGQELFRSQPVFRERLKECDATIQKETGWSLLDRLFSGEVASALSDVSFVQPALFAIQVALARLWMSWGVVPGAVVGHSMGEVAAAHIAGALSLADAAAVVCRRSKLLKRVSGQGAMALLELTMEEAAAAVRGTGAEVSIAASNGRRATVVSGDFATVLELVARLERRGVFCRVIKVDVASHSPQMDTLLRELEAALQEIRPMRGNLPIFSTVLGAQITGKVMDAAYWARNLREPVLFHPVVKELLAQGLGTFLELSPHPTLSSYVEETIGADWKGGKRKGAGVALSSLRRQEPELAALFNTLSELFVRGQAVDWPAVYPSGNPVNLPPFPWQRQTFWLKEAVKGLASYDESGNPLLGERVSTAANGSIWTSTAFASQPWLRDHTLATSVLMPATVYAELALEAGRQQAQDEQFQVEGLFVREAVFLPAATPVEMQTLVEEQSLGGHATRFYVRTVTDEQKVAGWTFAASATLVAMHPSAPELEAPRRIDPARFLRLQQGENKVGAKQHREEMLRRGYNFGPSFLCLDAYVLQESEAFGEARLPAGIDAPSSGLHTVLLDAGLQLLAALCYARGLWKGQLLPVRFGRIQAFGSGLPSKVVLVRASLPDAGKAGGDVLFYNESGGLVVKISDVLFKNVERDESLFVSGMMYGVEWEVAANHRQASVDEMNSWVILADRGDLGAELAQALRDRGVQVEVIAPATIPGTGLPEDGASEAIGTIPRILALNGDQTSVGVVDLRGCDIASGAGVDEASMHCAQITELVRSLTDNGIDARLWLVTRSAEAIPGDVGDVSIAQAAITGLAAVIANEHPELPCTSIDLSSERSLTEIGAVTDELLSTGDEGRVALRAARGGARRWVARLKPLTAKALPDATRQMRDGEAFQLEQLTGGDIDSLCLVALERRAPGELEVEIKVHAAGLSFRDVMQAMGLIDDPAGNGFSLGFEATGIVTRVGARVNTPQVGDSVMAISPGTQSGTLFASHAIVPAELAVIKPEGIGMAEAAALPGAYLTAYYGLVRLAHLRKGERVLIHAASGGVGLAAVQIATWLGAEIFATAGSEEKRRYLRKLGIMHVMDSRTSGFGEYIDRATDGAGVDVVLNSLAGGAVKEGMRALAPYGRFVEIGKRDMWRDSAMGMSALMQNRSFMGLDLASMAEERPGMVAGLLREILGLIEDRSLAALPVMVFPASQTAAAFQFMAQARQIGKVVIEMNDPDARIETAPDCVQADATYLITGGTGALGLESAKEFVDLGARHLVLTSRSEPSADALAQVAAFELKGVHARVRRVDVSDEAQLREVLREMRDAMPPLRGVIHAAGVLDDAVVANLDQPKFQTAMAGKSKGAMLLDRLTQDLPLDFFVMYSSIAGLLGSPGQGNYAAANAMLDALAHDRARRGLPAVSMNWGPWSDAGLAARQENRGARLAERGLQSISPAEGRMLLRQVLLKLRVLPCQAVLARVNRAEWVAYAPAVERSPFLSCLPDSEVRGDAAGGSTQIGERLRSMSARTGRQALLDHLREQAAMVVRMKPVDLPFDKPLRGLGLDSLMGVELRQRLEKSLGVRLSSSVIWNYPTIAELGDHLAQLLGMGPKSPPGAFTGGARPELETGAEAGQKAELTAMEMLSKEILEAEGLLRQA